MSPTKAIEEYPEPEGGRRGIGGGRPTVGRIGGLAIVLTDPNIVESVLSE